MALTGSFAGRDIGYYKVALAIGGPFTAAQRAEIQAEIARLTSAGLTDQRIIDGRSVAAAPGAPASPINLFPGVPAALVPQPFDPAVLEEARRRAARPVATAADILAASGPAMTEDGIPVTLPNDFYGFDVVSVAMDRTGSLGEVNFPAQVALAPIVVGSAALAARLGGSLGQRLLQWLIGTASGARLAWGSLPSWLRSAMALIGLSGATIAIDTATEGPIQLPSFGGGGGQGQIDIRVGRTYDGKIITNTWSANGIQFWATGSGRDLMHHVLKLDGSIKSWKPQRPVVLMPGGAKNIRDLLRADDIVDRQLKKVAKAIRRRNPTPRRPKQPQQVVVVDPQHAVLH